MNPINEFHKLAEQLDRINEYRSNHPEAFKPGSYCQRVYEQIVQELDHVIPQANAMKETCAALIDQFS